MECDPRYRAVDHKFRVIFALDRLETEIQKSSGDLTKISIRLLHVAGDNTDMNYDSSGYREVLWTDLLIYLVPLAAIALGTGLILPWWR